MKKTLAEMANRYMLWMEGEDGEADYIENGIVYCTSDAPSEEPEESEELDLDAEETESEEEEEVSEAKEDDSEILDLTDDDGDKESEDGEESDEEASDDESTDDGKKYAVFVSTNKKYDITDPENVEFIEEVEIPDRMEISNMKLKELKDSEYSSIEIDGVTYDDVKSASVIEEDGVMRWEEN